MRYNIFKTFYENDFVEWGVEIVKDEKEAIKVFAELYSMPRKCVAREIKWEQDAKVIHLWHPGYKDNMIKVILNGYYLDGGSDYLYEVKEIIANNKTIPLGKLKRIKL